MIVLGTTAVSLVLVPGALGAVTVPSTTTVIHPITAPAAAPSRPAAPTVAPFLVQDPLAYQVGKARAWNEYRNSAQPNSPAPQTAPWRGLSWNGMTAAVDSYGLTPPDGGGTIGPSHFIEAINAAIAVYNRATKAVVSGPTSFATFISGGSGPCDPQVEWDQGAQRYVFMDIECSTLSAHTMFFAFTKSSDPTDLTNGWCKYSITTSAFPDYPKMGKNNSDWGIGVNDYTSGGSFITSELFTIKKPANGTITTCPSLTTTSTGSGSVLTDVSGNTVFTEMAANQVDDSAPPGSGTASDALWFIGWLNGSASNAPVFKWSRDTSGTGTFVKEGDIPVTAYSLPASAPQPGTTNTLDTGDARGKGLTGHADSHNCGGCEAIWGAHNTGGTGGRSQVSWNEFNPSLCTGTPTCPTTADVQDGALNSPSLFYFNGNIAPDGTGYEAVMNFSSSSSSVYPQIRATSHNLADSAGHLHGQILLATSATFDSDFSCSPCRWGDYPAISPDPTNSGTVWGDNEFLNSPTSSSAAQWAIKDFAITPGEDQVYEDTSGIHVIGASGAKKTLVISGPASGTVTISDSNVDVTAVTTKGGTLGGACTQVSDTQVTCPSAGMPAVRVWLGDQNNTFNGSGLSMNTQVVTAPGNDTITTGSGNDLIQLNNDGTLGYVDTVDCGGGSTNTVNANTADSVNADCQHVTRYP